MLKPWFWLIFVFILTVHALDWSGRTYGTGKFTVSVSPQPPFSFLATQLDFVLLFSTNDAYLDYGIPMVAVSDALLLQEVTKDPPALFLVKVGTDSPILPTSVHCEVFEPSHSALSVNFTGLKATTDFQLVVSSRFMGVYTFVIPAMYSTLSWIVFGEYSTSESPASSNSGASALETYHFFNSSNKWWEGQSENNSLSSQGVGFDVEISGKMYPNRVFKMNSFNESGYEYELMDPISLSLEMNPITVSISVSHIGVYSTMYEFSEANSSTLEVDTFNLWVPCSREYAQALFDLRLANGSLTRNISENFAPYRAAIGSDPTDLSLIEAFTIYKVRFFSGSGDETNIAWTPTSKTPPGWWYNEWPQISGISCPAGSMRNRGTLDIFETRHSFLPDRYNAYSAYSLHSNFNITNNSTVMTVSVNGSRVSIPLGSSDIEYSAGVIVSTNISSFVAGMDGNVLFVPFQEFETTLNPLSEHWLFVPKEYVGDGCDQIGVKQNAFFNISDFCTQPRGTCLNYQISYWQRIGENATFASLPHARSLLFVPSVCSNTTRLRLLPDTILYQNVTSLQLSHCENLTDIDVAVRLENPTVKCPRPQVQNSSFDVIVSQNKRVGWVLCSVNNTGVISANFSVSFMAMHNIVVADQAYVFLGPGESRILSISLMSTGDTSTQVNSIILMEIMNKKPLWTFFYDKVSFPIDLFQGCFASKAEAAVTMNATTYKNGVEIEIHNVGNATGQFVLHYHCDSFQFSEPSSIHRNMSVDSVWVVSLNLIPASTLSSFCNFSVSVSNEDCWSSNGKFASVTRLLRYEEPDSTSPSSFPYWMIFVGLIPFTWSMFCLSWSCIVFMFIWSVLVYAKVYSSRYRKPPGGNQYHATPEQYFDLTGE